LHPCAAPSFANVGIKEPLAKYLVLVEFLNLTFENESSLNWDSNVKFIPLERQLATSKHYTGWLNPVKIQ